MHRSQNHLLVLFLLGFVDFSHLDDRISCATGIPLTLHLLLYHSHELARLGLFFDNSDNTGLLSYIQRQLVCFPHL